MVAKGWERCQGHNKGFPNIDDTVCVFNAMRDNVYTIHLTKPTTFSKCDKHKPQYRYM